jgi:hypothetical protein
LEKTLEVENLGDSKDVYLEVGNNVLPLNSNLARRLGITDTDCSLCNAAIENERHLFFDCPLPLARATWFDVNWSMRSDAIQADLPRDPQLGN